MADVCKLSPVSASPIFLWFLTTEAFWFSLEWTNWTLVSRRQAGTSTGSGVLLASAKVPVAWFPWMLGVLTEPFWCCGPDKRFKEYPKCVSVLLWGHPVLCQEVSPPNHRMGWGDLEGLSCSAPCHEQGQLPPDQPVQSPMHWYHQGTNDLWVFQLEYCLGKTKRCSTFAAGAGELFVSDGSEWYILLHMCSPFEELMSKTDTSLISLCPSPKTQQVVCYKNSLIRSHLST